MSHKFKVGDKVRHIPGYYSFGHEVGEVTSVEPLLVSGLYKRISRGDVDWDVGAIELPEWELVEPAPDPFKMDNLFKEGGKYYLNLDGPSDVQTTLDTTQADLEKVLDKPEEGDNRVHKFKVGDWVVPMEPEVISPDFKGMIGNVTRAEDYCDNEPIYEICFGHCVQTGYEDTDKLMSVKESMNEASEFYSDEGGGEGIGLKEEYRQDDPVNSPSHYGQGTIEAIEYIEDFLTQEEFIGYLRGNIAKYMHRWRYKNGLEDLKKAQWYLNKLIETMETEE